MRTPRPARPFITAAAGKPANVATIGPKMPSLHRNGIQGLRQLPKVPSARSRAQERLHQTDKESDGAARQALEEAFWRARDQDGDTRMEAPPSHQKRHLAHGLRRIAQRKQGLLVGRCRAGTRTGQLSAQRNEGMLPGLELSQSARRVRSG
jgi:hypothetical protein